MTREEQIRKAADDYCGDDTREQSPCFYAHIHNAFLEGVAWADSHPQWISVDKELPPKRKDPIVISDKVFIHTTGGHYLSAVYDYQDKEWIDEYNIETLKPNEVTHWMKIVPPRKEANNKR